MRLIFNAEPIIENLFFVHQNMFFHSLVHCARTEKLQHNKILENSEITKYVYAILERFQGR